MVQSYSLTSSASSTCFTLQQMQPHWPLPRIHLIEERGRNAKLIDWLDEITADY